MNINEKIEKKEQKLTNLKTERNKLDDRIKKLEDEIERYKNIVTQQKFSEVTQVLKSNGLTIDEIMQAVKSGDMLSLQERLEGGKNKNTSEGTSEEPTE